MGRIEVQIKLENTVDSAAFRRGWLKEEQVRREELPAMVDTGAVMLLLPQEVVDRLGLEVQREIRVSYADDRKEKRSVAGPLTIKIGDRFMNTDCIIGPESCDALIGQVVLEELDLLADCTNRRLVPHPESPDYPLLSLK